MIFAGQLTRSIWSLVQLITLPLFGIAQLVCTQNHLYLYMYITVLKNDVLILYLQGEKSQYLKRAIIIFKAWLGGVMVT